MGHVPHSNIDLAFRYARNRMRRLRAGMGRRSSLSGQVAALVFFVIRPLVPSWRKRVARIRSELVRRATLKYTLGAPPPGMLTSSPGAVLLVVSGKLNAEQKQEIRYGWKGLPHVPPHPDEEPREG